jgi:hypothetical protein
VFLIVNPGKREIYILFPGIPGNPGKYKNMLLSPLKPLIHNITAIFPFIERKKDIILRQFNRFFSQNFPGSRQLFSRDSGNENVAGFLY